MGMPPSKNHELDRIDNAQGYYKENCRWTLHKINCRNQDRTVFIQFNGSLRSLKEVAEEILADIFVIIWQKSSMFDINSGNLYSWLINLSRNKALDFIRREKSLITDEYNDEYENVFIIPTISTLIPSNDLDKTFNNREKIYSAVHSLTEAQQYVLSLAYYDGLTESEIAAKLNIPLLTVKSKIRVALNSVKENLAKEEIQ